MREILTVGLAAWRLARLLVREEGPFEVLARIRWFVGIPEVGMSYRAAPHGPVWSFLRGILTCQWCCTMWAAGILWALRRTPAARVLAAAGIAAMIVRIEEISRDE